MNWLNAIKDDDTVASRDVDATRASLSPDRASTSWDPHEVWLTRVKQPRELAARRATGSPVGNSFASGT